MKSPSARWLYFAPLAVLLGASALCAWTLSVFLTGPVISQPELRPQRRVAEDALVLAGSGSNLPLTRLLAEAWGRRVYLHESIGSRGGVRAVRDGAIDLGLISRPLREEEQQGLVVWPYARVAVVIASGSSVPEQDFDEAGLAQLYSGVRRTWPDGTALRVVQRELGDSSHDAVERHWLRFAEASHEAYRRQRWRVVYADASMRAALLSERGSVGLFDQGAVRIEQLPLRIHRVEGVRPSPETLESGAYPFSKDLSMLSVGPPSDLARDFLGFIYSDRGRDLTRRAGYLPLERPAAERP
ncbi:MAG: substrate-binding domain-containing protein [Deltaproteobacteria bacterium]|nr:substrate-binding domain-containing protein [Deltaproteobacteria bacterium]